MGWRKPPACPNRKRTRGRVPGVLRRKPALFSGVKAVRSVADGACNAIERGA